MSSIKFKTILTILVSTQLFSCSSAWLTHYNNKEKLESEEAVFIDAKQRVVYSIKKPKIIKVGDTDTKVTFSGYCAEPSPDALSSLAATLGVDLSVKDKGELGIANTMAEGVSNIGIRTVAIQALRDFMYRNCEAYALGGITDFGLETLQRRFQSTMVGIMAIEQLTGAVKAPSVTITSNTSIGSPDAILELTNKSSVALEALNNSKSTQSAAKTKSEKSTLAQKNSQNEIDDFKKAITDIEAKKEEDRSTDEKEILANKDTKSTELENNLKVAKEKADKDNIDLETANSGVKKSQQAYDAIEDSREAAITGGGQSKTTATYAQYPEPKPLSAESVEKIATAVKEIVQMTINGNLRSEVCTTIIGQYPDTPAIKGTTLYYCNSLLFADTQEDRNKLLKNFKFDDGWNEEEPAKKPIMQELDREAIQIDNIVKKIQKQLRQLDFTDARNQIIEPDGVWGESTLGALNKMIQKCGGISESIKSLSITQENIPSILSAVNEAYDKDCSSDKF